MDSRFVFSEEEFKKIQQGYDRRPSMDYRWYITTENDCVYILRSWNPFIVFKTQFEKAGDIYVSKESLSQFEVTTEDNRVSISKQNYRNFWIYSLITQLIFNEPELMSLDSLLYKAAVDFNGVHGFAHWRAIYRNGIKLFPEIDKTLLFYFSVFHDFFRNNDFSDKAHGKRALVALPLIKENLKMKGKDKSKIQEQLDILAFTFEHHDDNPEEYNAIENPLKDNTTVRILIDADRLDLGRVGITPLSEYLLTEQGKEYNGRSVQGMSF